MSKFLLLIVVASASLVFVSCGEKKAPAPAFPPAVVAAAAGARELEAGCAGCVYHMDGAEGCQLAVLVDGKHYYVSGVDMPGHESGLCDGPQRALVLGKVDGDRFVATAFAMKP